MKQGNPARKRFGLVALIGAMIGGFVSRPEESTVHDLQRRKSELLTNGGVAPIPTNIPNQRQRRKIARQTQRF